MYPDNTVSGKDNKTSLGEIVYYNPKCDFNNTAEEISEEFWDFVNKWENL